jgi:hypothetical protein
MPALVCLDYTHAVKHLVFILGLCGALTLTAQSQQPPAGAFQIEETTIAQIHAAMRAGRLTCRGLVEQYLTRIEAYDKAGPALNAIVVVNPDALAQADAMDRLARSSRTTSKRAACRPRPARSRSRASCRRGTRSR